MRRKTDGRGNAAQTNQSAGCQGKRVLFARNKGERIEIEKSTQNRMRKNKLHEEETKICQKRLPMSGVSQI